MICTACGKAGDTLASARFKFPSLWRLGITVAKLMHQECLGHDACDCLHRIT